MKIRSSILHINRPRRIMVVVVMHFCLALPLILLNHPINEQTKEQWFSLVQAHKGFHLMIGSHGLVGIDGQKRLRIIKAIFNFYYILLSQFPTNKNNAPRRHGYMSPARTFKNLCSPCLSVYVIHTE